MIRIDLELDWILQWHSARWEYLLAKRTRFYTLKRRDGTHKTDRARSLLRSEKGIAVLFKDILPPQYILADNRALLLKITSFTVVRAFPYVKTSFSFPPSLSLFLPLPLRGEIPVYWGRMRMGFRRSGVRSSVLSNLGTNRSCDRLKIHTDCALILIFLFLPSLRAFHARQRHNAPFRDYKKLPRTPFCSLTFHALSPFIVSREKDFVRSFAVQSPRRRRRSVARTSRALNYLVRCKERLLKVRNSNGV